MTNDSDPVLTLRQAAEAAGVSVSTLRRRREALAKAGATISNEGWQVPLSALIETGLMSTPTRSREVPQIASEKVSEAPVKPAEVTALRLELDEWRRRAEVAEAIAEERGRALADMRQTMEVERMALRMLTAGNDGHEVQVSDSGSHGSQMSAAEVPSVQAPEPSLQRRGLFGRLFG